MRSDPLTHRHVTPPKARKHTRAVHCVRADSLETWRYQVKVVAGKFLGAIGMEGMTNIVIVVDSYSYGATLFLWSYR